MFSVYECIPFRSNRRVKAFVRGTKLLLALGKCLLQKESNHNLINKSIDVALSYHKKWTEAKMQVKCLLRCRENSPGR